MWHGGDACSTALVGDGSCVKVYRFVCSKVSRTRPQGEGDDSVVFEDYSSKREAEDEWYEWSSRGEGSLSSHDALQPAPPSTPSAVSVWILGVFFCMKYHIMSLENFVLNMLYSQSEWLFLVADFLIKRLHR